MAYTKHFWRQRLGVGLNKYTNSGDAVNLILTPAPDQITQEGTPFSAQWMNEMEQGIADGQVLVFDGAPTGTAAEGQIGVDASQNPTVLYVYQNGAWVNLSAAGIKITAATAAALGLPSGATVEDAIKASSEKVGDILQTVRTDLSDNWLLCNGDSVSSSDYPELVPLLFGQVPSINSRVNVGTVRTTISGVARSDNGVIVAVGTATASPYAPYAYMSEDGGQSWTATRIKTTAFTMLGVVWDGTKFVAYGANTRSSSAGTEEILTSTDGVTWQTAATGFFASGQYTEGGSMTYDGETFIFVGWTLTRGSYFAATTDLSTFVTSQIEGQSAYNHVTIATKYNGIYYAFGCYYNNQSAEGYTYIKTSTDGQTWTIVILSGSSIAVHARWVEVSARGVFIIGDNIGTSFGGTSTGVISLCASSISGTYTQQEITRRAACDDVITLGGTFVILNTNQLWVNDDPINNTTWTSVPIDDTTYGQANTGKLLYLGGEIPLLAVGEISNTGTTAYLPRAWFFATAGKLPLISLNGAYAYIKAIKEAST